MVFQNFITDSTLIAFRTHELTAWIFSPKIVKSFYPWTIFAKKAPSEIFDWVLNTFRLPPPPPPLSFTTSEFHYNPVRTKIDM